MGTGDWGLRFEGWSLGGWVWGFGFGVSSDKCVSYSLEFGVCSKGPANLEIVGQARAVAVLILPPQEPRNRPDHVHLWFIGNVSYSGANLK